MKLSVAERIELVEDIWDSIAASPESLAVTPAQKRELGRRLERHRSDPDSGRSWEEIRDSLEETP